MNKYNGIPKDCRTCAMSHLCGGQSILLCKRNNYRDYREDDQLISRYMESSTTLLPVICISVRGTFRSQIHLDSKYFIDKMSIYIDRDGDAYGSVFTTNGERIGNLKLSHFRGDL